MTETKRSTEKQRSLSQNNSLHQWCTDVAGALEELGISRKTIVQDLADADIPITMEYIKQVLWFHFMVGMTGKTKTSQLSTDEVTKIEKTTLEHLKKKYKIDVEWWSQEAQYWESYEHN